MPLKYYFTDIGLRKIRTPLEVDFVVKACKRYYIQSTLIPGSAHLHTLPASGAWGGMAGVK